MIVSFYCILWASGRLTGSIPTSSFSFRAQQICKVVRVTKDIDLPIHKGILSNIEQGP